VAELRIASSTVRQFEDMDSAAVWLEENDMGDGLPIVVPTVDRVKRFIEGSGFQPDTVLGPVAPRNGVATVENIAISAVMAGCKPEHLGTVLAAVEAMLKPGFKLRPLQTTTNPAAPLAIVNGPIRQRIGIDSGRNALGPGRHSNGVIGRAIRLVLRNVGGAIGDVDMATLGNPFKYTFCLAEAEENSPWPPLHVSLGYDSADSVVTVIASESLVNVCASYREAEPIIDLLLKAMRGTGVNLTYSSGSLLLIISPGHAEILAKHGWDRSELQERLFSDSMIPETDFPYGNCAQGHWIVNNGRVQVTEAPEDIHIIVAGGTEAIHSVYAPAYCIGKAQSAKVWDPSARLSKTDQP
jgi:hypothetical protein